MESLADSILSMSLSQVVSQTHAKLSDEKLKALRNFTKQQQQIPIIKPKRPDRVDLKSEVILETKLETERKQKEIIKKMQQHQQQQLQVQQQQQQQYIQQQQYMVNKTPINLQQKSQPNANYQTSLQQQLLRPQATMVQIQQQQPVIAKPTASKPSMVTSQPPVFITPTSSTSATISFGGNSSFVKTSQSVSITKTEEVSKTTASSTPFTGFGMPQQAGGHNFVQPKPLQATTSVSSESKENLPLTTPISFSAKVIGGNDNKTFGNKTNTTSNMVQSPISQGFAAATSASGFSAFATTKPVVAAKGTQDKSENKQPDEAPKTVSNVATVSTASVTTPFAGFGFTTKSTVSSTAATPSPFSTSLFGSNSSSNNTPVSTPFSGQPFSSSAFSFTAATSTPSTAPSTVEGNTAKAVTNTAQSTAPGVKITEVKPTLTSSATTATVATPTR